jgi:hypothetical protein
VADIELTIFLTERSAVDRADFSLVPYRASETSAKFERAIAESGHTFLREPPPFLLEIERAGDAVTKLKERIGVMLERRDFDDRDRFPFSASSRLLVCGVDINDRIGVALVSDGVATFLVGAFKYVSYELLELLRRLGESDAGGLTRRLSTALEDLTAATSRIIDLVEQNELLRGELASRNLYVESLQRQLQNVRDADAAGSRRWLAGTVAALGLAVSTFGVVMDRVDNAAARNATASVKECGSHVTNITNIVNEAPQGTFMFDGDELPFAG